MPAKMMSAAEIRKGVDEIIDTLVEEREDIFEIIVITHDVNGAVALSRMCRDDKLAAAAGILQAEFTREWVSQ